MSAPSTFMFLFLTLPWILLPCSCFNLEPRYSLVIHDPEYSNGSYFGYALAFWRESHEQNIIPWLLVGAPRGSVSSLTGDRVRQPGALYKCSLQTLNPICSMVPVLPPGESVQQDLKWRRQKMNIPARSWVGATIAVENKPGGAVAVCAPRMKRVVQKDAWFIPGACFHLQHGQVTPLEMLEKANDNGFHAGLAQVGISAQFVPNSNSSQLLVGATGVNYFKGSLNVYERKMVNQGKEPRGLPNLHTPTVSKPKMYSYLGYSVATAQLHSDGRTSFLSGAPRAEGEELFTGVVYVVEDPVARANWRVAITLKGQQMGEYFGSSVAALDVEGDGVDDLVVVGAPLHSPRSTDPAPHQDSGLVYIFRNTGEAVLEETPSSISGSMEAGARFGSSLAAIGDLDKDGYNDLAVGAPYEEGGLGAVYIFLGREGGLNRKYSQRILSSDINPRTPAGLRGFGISITSGLDIDDNGFNDLAIGSYDSGNAVVIKSYPVIKFEASLHPNVVKLGIDARNFSVEACLRYNSSALVHQLPAVDVEVKVKVDQSLRRAVVQVEGETDGHRHSQLKLRRSLNHRQQSCWKLLITLTKNLTQVMQPVDFVMSYKVLDNPSTKREEEFCKSCPMTDPRQPSSVSVRVPFANGCGGKDVCRADLKMEAHTSNNGTSVILGKDAKLSLNATVWNVGEPAYMSKLFVSLPLKSLLVKVPQNCYLASSEGSSKSQGEMMLCGLANPLFVDTNTTVNRVTTQLEIDLSGVPLLTSSVVVILTAWSASEEDNPEDNTVVISIPIKLESKLLIGGNTLQKHIILPTKKERESSIVLLSHKYEVINEGPSPVGAVDIDLWVPVAVSRPSQSPLQIAAIKDPQVTLGGHLFACEADENHARNSSTDENAEGTANRRRQRSLEGRVENVTQAEGWGDKRALSLKCTDAGSALCATVRCHVAPVPPGARAEIVFNLDINVTTSEYLLVDFDVIQFSTLGRVNIADSRNVSTRHRHDVASVETLIMGEVTGDEIPSWVLPLAIILGLLLLLLIVKLLSNVGFFKRGHKEKLECMKEKAVEEEFEVLEFLDDFDNDLLSDCTS